MSILPRLRLRSIPELRKQILPALIEALGLGMIIGGLWFLNPVASMIALGFVLVIIAQGISAERGNP